MKSTLPENNPNLRSFIDVSTDSHFPIQNLPFGVFRPKTGGISHVATAIGDYVLDLAVLETKGLFDGPLLKGKQVFNQPDLNAFMSLGRLACREARATLSRLLRVDEPTLRDDVECRKRAFFARNEVEMLLPINVGGYTDFYSSKEHAMNMGLMFRGKESPLLPNWLHLPVGYDGRASSIVVSGTPFRRPLGQIKPADSESPIYTESQQLDVELEVAFIVGTPNKLGESIPIDKTVEHVFGVTLLADWSARDIQKWEYIPLGPFLSKNFCTTIAPWIVTLDALEPFRTPSPEQEPQPLPYLRSTRNWGYDIQLELLLQTAKMSSPQRVALTNYRGIYWDFCQQLAHHTVNGCKMNSGDIFASGTISGPTPDTFGSMVEITWGGAKPVKLTSGEERKFLQDGDQVIIDGWCQGKGYCIGFGALTGKVLPAQIKTNEE